MDKRKGTNMSHSQPLIISDKAHLNDDDDYYDEEDIEKQQRKRFWTIIIGFTVLCAIIAGLLIYFVNKSGKNDGDVTLTVKDKSEISQLSKDFIQSSGNWGLKDGVVNADNVMSTSYIINAATNEDNRKDYYVSRQSSYSSYKDKLLAQNGNLYYNENILDSWDGDYIANSMIGFKTQGVNIKVPDVGTLTRDNDEESVAVSVPVNFESVAKQYVQSGNDSDWDGTYNILQKNYPINATISIVKVDGSWKVSDIMGVSKPFVLSSYMNAGSNYASSIGTFKVVDKIKSTEYKGYKKQ